jgi:ferritin-like metal-binding protein YciE
MTTVQNLEEMCKAQLSHLAQLRASAEKVGDVEQVTLLDEKLAQTQETLNKLQNQG